MFYHTEHGSAPIAHNAHVVAYYKAQVGDWNKQKFRFAAKETRETYNQVILGYLNLWRLEQMRGRMTADDICRKCGDIALESGLCLVCED